MAATGLDQLFHKRDATVFRIAGRKHQGHDGQPLRIDAGIDGSQTHETVEEQSSSHQEHHRHGDLGDHETTSEPDPAMARRGGLASVFEALVHIRARRLESRYETEEHTRCHRDADGKQQDPQVHRDGIHPRDTAGIVRAEGLNSAERQDDPKHTADQGQENAFGKQLIENPRPAGTQGRPQGHFPTPMGAARQKKVGNIGTGDQEHEADGPKQHPQRRIDLSSRRFVERDQRVRAGRTVPSPILIGKLFGQPGGEDIDIRLRRPDIDSRTELADHSQRIAVATVHRLAVHVYRQPHVDSPPPGHGFRTLERRRQDTYNFDGRPVQMDRLPHRSGITAPLSLPEPVAQHCHSSGVADEVISLEEPPELCVGTEHREEVLGDVGTEQALRTCVSGHVEPAAPGC